MDKARIQEIERKVHVPVFQKKVDIVQDKIVVVGSDVQIVERLVDKLVVVQKEVIRKVPV